MRGDLIITPGDDKTRSALDSLIKEGNGVEKTEPRWPRILIYDTESDMDSMDILHSLAVQNPELGLSLDEIKKQVIPLFKTGPKGLNKVH